MPLRRLPTWLAPALPAVLLYAVIYLPSLAILLVLSVYTYRPGLPALPSLTVGNYERFVTDSYYLDLLVGTLRLALVASVLALLAGYPLAYVLVRSSRMRRIVLPVVALSFFVSAILRLYGWMGILGAYGVLNGTLLSLGAIATPIPILFTDNAVIVGLTDFAIPYTVLVLAGSIANLDPALEQAAQNLGATRWQTFLRVTLPLTLPGLMAALVVAFVLSVSAVVTPLILGGGRVPMLATQVYDSMILSVNYPFASATVMIILVVTGLLIALLARAGRAAWLQGQP